MDVLAIALFLSVFTNRVIEAFVAPIKKRYVNFDMWWLVYVSWLLGGVVGWLSGVNLFAPYIPNPLAGQIMTSIVIGGGANLINDIFGSGGEIIIEDINA